MIPRKQSASDQALDDRARGIVELPDSPCDLAHRAGAVRDGQQYVHLASRQPDDLLDATEQLLRSAGNLCDLIEESQNFTHPATGFGVDRHCSVRTRLGSHHGALTLRHRALTGEDRFFTAPPAASLVVVRDICLLYTSDAADDLTRVALGVRRH